MLMVVQSSLTITDTAPFGAMCFLAIKVMDYFVGRFKLKHERDLTTSPKAMAKLRREAERAKRALSADVTVKVEIPAIMDDIDFVETLTRAKFEELVCTP